MVHVMDVITLGRRIREQRLSRGLSQRALCARAGVSPRFLVQLEQGSANPSIGRLSDLARALGLSVTSLVAGLGPADAVDEIASICRGMPLSSRRRVLLGLRDSRKEKVALVGLRGAGKTTLGRALAETLEAPFVELDRSVEERAGMGLSDLFEFHGAARYRDLARASLEATLAQPGAAVIEIGGSLVADEELYAVLRQHCRVVWLRASPEEHLRRVQEQGDLRPMAGWADPLAQLRTLLASREALYGLADLAVETDVLGVEGSLGRLVSLG